MVQRFIHGWVVLFLGGKSWRQSVAEAQLLGTQKSKGHPPSESPRDLLLPAWYGQLKTKHSIHEPTGDISHSGHTNTDYPTVSFVECLECALCTYTFLPLFLKLWL